MRTDNIWSHGVMRVLMTVVLCLIARWGSAQDVDSVVVNAFAVDTLAADTAALSTMSIDSVAAAVPLLGLDSTHTARVEHAIQAVLGTKGKKGFRPNPKKSLWFSLIPGGGQIYNRKYWKLPIVYGGFFGCIYALNWNNGMYRDYQQAYVDIMDDDPDTHSYLDMLPLNYDITGKEERFKTIFKNKKDYYRKYRDMSIFIMIGVWALATIDAYVDAELSSYDITKDLTLRLQPAVFGLDRAHATAGSGLGGGVQMSLTF